MTVFQNNQRNLQDAGAMQVNLINEKYLKITNMTNIYI